MSSATTSQLPLPLAGEMGLGAGQQGQDAHGDHGDGVGGKASDGIALQSSTSAVLLDDGVLVSTWRRPEEGVVDVGVVASEDPSPREAGLSAEEHARRGKASNGRDLGATP
mmetsp:Transcript_134610/g.335886  ORF Transcript_134610/g.335886 Transcript_134610/m.335886 type:complete len:111 (-) Transcript_134610:1106-1438(-)